jgi:DNA-binding NtrC family response regulator
MAEKILLIEGEGELRKRYREMLKSSGYNVIAADSGKHALQKFKEEDVDVIVTDIVLPDGRGFDYLKKMLASRRNVKVVIHTDHIDYKSDFNSWLADAFLTKSADLAQLDLAIKKVLQPN